MITTGRLAAILLLPLAAALADAALAAEPDAFVVHSVTGVDFTGPLKKLAPDGSVQLGGARPVISATEIVTIRRTPLHLPSFPERAVVVLTHGDRVPMDPEKPLKLDDGRLYFHVRPATRADPVRIPRAFVALLWLAVPEGTRDPDLLIGRLLDARRSRDVLLLRNGDQLAGTVTAIDPAKGVRIDANGREVTVALAQVSGIAFNTELQARLRRPKAYTHVVLVNGGRLSFSTMQLDAAKLAGKTLFGARLEIPLTAAAALEPRSERVVYLSDIKPKSFEHTPFLNTSWPLAADAAVTGRPLRLGGNTFDKGLGMHSKSRVTYALDGRFRWFEALVGLDDRAGRRGRARLQIVVDGKEQILGPEKELTGKDAPLPVRIDVNKARELTLVVDFGSYGDVQAHVNWADARLIR
jgi:hypothetical protein